MVDSVGHAHQTSLEEPNPENDGSFKDMCVAYVNDSCLERYNMTLNQHERYTKLVNRSDLNEQETEDLHNLADLYAESKHAQLCQETVIESKKSDGPPKVDLSEWEHDPDDNQMW